jgi:uncharacterized membrane protein
MPDAASSDRPSLKSKLGVTLLAVLTFISLRGSYQMPQGEALSEWGHFLGRFHPVVLHLPIGMVSLLVLMELRGLFWKSRRVGQLPIALAAISGVAAAFFGQLLYSSQPTDFPEDLVRSHQAWGMAFASALLGCWVLRVWLGAWTAGLAVYLLGLLAACGVMVVASHDGGSLTHGKNYLTDEVPSILRAPMGLPPKELRKKQDAPKPEAPVSADPVVYKEVLEPILASKCYSCHNAEKQKGRLRMDTYELMLKGGIDGDGIKPGSSADSTIVQRIELPEEDEEHMPPSSKEQVTPDELALLKAWLDAGASPDAKASELKLDPALLQKLHGK